MVLGASIRTTTPTPLSRSIRPVGNSTRGPSRPARWAMVSWSAGSGALARAHLGGGGPPACVWPAGTRPAGRRGTSRAGAATADAGARQAVRTPGKSDPIDALAVARAALREPPCRSPSTTRRSGRSSCWSTTLSSWWPSAPGRQPAALAPAPAGPDLEHATAGCPARAGSHHRQARPGRRRRRLLGAGQDLPGPSAIPTRTDQVGELDRQLRQRVAQQPHRCSACLAAGH
jgi:hypothetical protein